jgi:pSer/pThr/pTyr-binding forkhead associated (FHA) protein
MPKFLIKLPSQQKYIFEFSEEIQIGRGDDCNLIFSDTSVSRHHATVSFDEEAFIEDHDSQNGLVIDGVKAMSGVPTVISSRMEIQIGKFTLIYLTDAKEDQFHRNKSISYLPKYTPNTLISEQEDTLQLSRKQATLILREQNTLNNACVISNDDRRFYPESNDLHFGGSKAQVKVNGWFTGGIVATISWNGHQHVIEKKGGFMTSVLVNDKSVSTHNLTINDTIIIGKSIFKYTLGDSKS